MIPSQNQEHRPFFLSQNSTQHCKGTPHLQDRRVLMVEAILICGPEEVSCGTCLPTLEFLSLQEPPHCPRRKPSISARRDQHHLRPDLRTQWLLTTSDLVYCGKWNRGVFWSNAHETVLQHLWKCIYGFTVLSIMWEYTCMQRLNFFSHFDLMTQRYSMICPKWWGRLHIDFKHLRYQNKFWIAEWVRPAEQRVRRAPVTFKKPSTTSSEPLTSQGNRYMRRDLSNLAN